MSWTAPEDMLAQVRRLWERGELLRDCVTGDVRFPLRLPLTSPSSTDITQRFELVRLWAEQLAAIKAVRIEWQEVRHRVQGTQCLPASVWIDSLDEALGWIGKRADFKRFCAQLTVTRQAHAALIPWLAKRPLIALELSADWRRLLAVVSWLQQHECPGIYLRQVDIEGVHSKFIETHRAVLAELFDLALPSHAIDATKTGLSQFAGRYGFLDKPLRIRFRILDAALTLLPGVDCPDMTLDAPSFSRLQLSIKHVFICENEINFLAFPSMPQSIAIFGAGYGWQSLAGCAWLNKCAIHYWGDIDTHGFGILNQLRGYFAHVDSLLMDRATLDVHQPFWGLEDKPLRIDLSRLTSEESQLYNDLRDNCIRTGLRLEQEHIGYRWLCHRLKA